MKHETITANEITQQWDGWGEFLASAKETANPQMSSHRGYASFCGTSSFAEAVKLAETGWPEGLNKIKQLTASLKEGVSNKTYRDQIKYDVCGDWYDIGRVIEGDPECACEFERVFDERAGNVVTVAINTAVSGSIGSKVIETRGAAVVALVDALESANIRCEVILTFGVFNVNLKAHLKVVIKREDESLDMDQLAFALAHPSTLRRLFFAIEEGWPEPFFSNFPKKSYGRPTTNKFMADADIKLDEAHAASSNWASVERAQAWVESELKKYVKFED